MPELKIQAKYLSGLITIAQMPDEIARSLGEVLKTEHPALLNKDLVTLVTNSVKGLGRDKTADVVNTLLWVAAGHFVLNVPISDLAREISQTTALELPTEEREILASRMAQFIDTKAIGITSKALDVLTEHNNTFYDARVMTDIRPIFGEDPTEIPAAAVITHMLKIHYHHGTDHDEFFVVLDSGDLKSFRQILDRAESKAATLKSFIEATGITYLDPEGDTNAE